MNNGYSEFVIVGTSAYFKLLLFCIFMYFTVDNFNFWVIRIIRSMKEYHRMFPYTHVPIPVKRWDALLHRMTNAISGPI